MAEKKDINGFLLVSIVAIVAVVALVVLVTRGMPANAGVSASTQQVTPQGGILDPSQMVKLPSKDPDRINQDTAGQALGNDDCFYIGTRQVENQVTGEMDTQQCFTCSGIFRWYRSCV